MHSPLSEIRHTRNGYYYCVPTVNLVLSWVCWLISFFIVLRGRYFINYSQESRRTNLRGEIISVPGKNIELRTFKRFPFFCVKSSNQIGQHPKKTERSFKAFSQRSYLISQLTVLVMWRSLKNFLSLIRQQQLQQQIHWS